MYQNAFEVRLKPDLHVTSSELHIHLENHWKMLQLPAEVHLKPDLNATSNEFPITRKSCDRDFGQELTRNLWCAFIDRSGGEVRGLGEQGRGKGQREINARSSHGNAGELFSGTAQCPRPGKFKKVRFVSRAQNALAKLPTSSSLPNIGAPPLDARGDSLGH